MIKKLNFPLIFLVYLTCLLYFSIFRFNWLVCSLLLFSLGLALLRNYFLMLPILLILGSIFLTIKLDENQKISHEPAAVTSIQPLIDTIEVNGDSLSFRGKSNAASYQVYYQIKSEKEKSFYQNLQQNVSLEITGDLEIPETQKNFNGFDYQKYLASQNIYRILKIKEIKKISFLHQFDLRQVRRSALIWSREHFPKPMEDYMTGLLFGYLSKDFDEMGDIYTSLGIIHLFALSGMQVNFFLDLLRKILLRMGLRRDYFKLFQLPFSIFYAFLTGLSVSVLRALVQKNVPLKGLDNFSVSFFVLLLISPKFLLTTGGALTLFYAFVLSMLSGKFKELSGLKKVMLESAVLSIAVLPLLIFYFYSFQPISIILTFFFGILFDLILLPGLLILFLLSLIGLTISQVNFLFVWLEELIKLVDQFFHYPLVLGKPSIAILFLLLVVSAYFIDGKRKILLAFALFILLFIGKNPINPTITLINVGQGDSILLEDKFNSKKVMIDVGGKVEFAQPKNWQKRSSSTNAEKTVIPYLKSRGIGSLDIFVASHTDEDHIGDLVALAKQIKIKEIWLTPGALTRPSFVSQLKAVKSQIHIVKIGDKIPIFNSNIEVIYPSKLGDGGNNDSVVLYGRFFKSNFLFMGDLEKEGEQEIMANYPHLAVEVLKAGHHGSKTSSSAEFIKQIKPEIALISVGKNNRYKHPNQETLDTFNNNQVRIFRTDQDGAIRFEEKNGIWRIQKVNKN